LEFAHGALACQGPTVTETRNGQATTIHAPDIDMFAGHRTLLGAFAVWLQDGLPVETTLADNLRSLAAVFAAIESSRTGATVPVSPGRTETATRDQTRRQPSAGPASQPAQLS
jgi:hypothetical protein